jgi:putative transposon-encoded protein
MTKASFTSKEIEGIVKTWGKGGAYVSIPSAWQGKRVRVILLDE